MWSSHYEGLHRGSVWRHLSRRKGILPSKRSTYTCYGMSFSFRISCISFRIDVINICRWFRTQTYIFPFTITLYAGDSCHSVRMFVYIIMYDRPLPRIEMFDLLWWEKNIYIYIYIYIYICKSRRTLSTSYNFNNISYYYFTQIT